MRSKTIRNLPLGIPGMTAPQNPAIRGGQRGIGRIDALGPFTLEERRDGLPNGDCDYAMFTRCS